MKNIILNIPENINLDEREAKRFLAAKLFEAGKLSLGQAAALAGLSKIAFSEILADFDVSLINYPASDIIKDAGQFQLMDQFHAAVAADSAEAAADEKSA